MSDDLFLKRVGGASGKSLERTLSESLTTPDGFQTRITNTPDGGSVRLDTCGGMHRTTVSKPRPPPPIPVYHYWMWTFQYAPTTDTKSQNVSVFTDATQTLAVFSHAAAPVYKNHKSQDGLLEIWEKVQATVRPANASTFLVDAADDDGPHAHEVTAWLFPEDTHVADDRLLAVPCEIDGGIIAFGNPWHGEIYDGVIHTGGGDVNLPAPTTVYLPYTHKVQFAGVPDPHEGMVLPWKKYAILYDYERRYLPFGNLRMGWNGHLYRSPSGTPWMITYYVETANLTQAQTLFVYARCCTVGYDDMTPILLVQEALSFAKYGSTLPQPVFNFSPDGTKVAVNMAGFGSLAEYTSCKGDLRESYGVTAIYEITLGHGDSPTDDPMNGRAALIKNYTEINSVDYSQLVSWGKSSGVDGGSLASDGYASYTDADNFVLHWSGVNSNGTTPTEFFETDYRRTDRVLLLGAYSNADILQVFESVTSDEVINEFEYTNTHTPPYSESYSYLDPVVAGLHVAGIWESQPPDRRSRVMNKKTRNTSCKILMNGVPALERTAAHVHTTTVVTTRVYTANAPGYDEVATADNQDSYTLDGEASDSSHLILTGLGVVVSNNVIAAHDAGDPDYFQVLTPDGLHANRVLKATAYGGEVDPWISWNPATNELAAGKGHTWI